MGSVVTIGVLALQGDFAEHEAILHGLGVKAREVRLPRDLEGIDSLGYHGLRIANLARHRQHAGFDALADVLGNEISSRMGSIEGLKSSLVASGVPESGSAAEQTLVATLDGLLAETTPGTLVATTLE